MRLPRPPILVVLAAMMALTFAPGGAVSAATDAPDVSAALLVADDLPPALSPGGITHEPAFDYDSASFDASGGLDKAAQTWQAAEMLPDMPVVVVFDFRFLFPDPAAAEAYLDAAEPILSESVTGITLQPDTPLVGDELRHYAGELSQGDVTIGAQNFLFRVGPVVAKVYVTGFGTSIEDALPIAQAAADRTSAWLSEQPSASPGQPETSPAASLIPEPSLGPGAPASSPGPGASVELDDGTVRQWASGASASSEYGSDAWSALQATGEPDVGTYSDTPAAWAPSGSDAGIQWLELTFDQPVVPAAITIVESFGSGAVIQVEAFDPSADAWVALWSGQSPATEEISTFSPPLSEITFATNRLKITLDTDLVPGYNEIDAVELVGTPS